MQEMEVEANDSAPSSNATGELDKLIADGRQADVVFGIWESVMGDDGLNVKVLKGESLLRDAMLENEAPAGTVIVLTCEDVDQAKVLAYVLDGKPLSGQVRAYQGTSHGSTASTHEPPTTRNQSWNATPQRRLLKCMIAAMWKEGDRGQAVVTRFKKLVPNYQSYFDRPIGDQAIIQRGDCAWRYPGENPDKNPKLRPYWPLAQTLVSDEDPEDAARALGDPDAKAKTMA